MPEGDTVYRYAHMLNDALAGAVLTGCDIRVPTYATVDLSGDTVDEVVSAGKHLLIRVGDYSIHSHLKMEGTWRLFRPGVRWTKPAHQARIVLTAATTADSNGADWIAVGFELGMLDVVARQNEDTLIGHLGPDLLGPDWNAAQAVHNLQQHAAEPIATALLDQRNLAGLGNEYVAELCFLRGMLPTRPVARVDLAKTVELAHRLITANKLRRPRTTTGDLHRGRTSWVYGRDGQACRRCGTRIRRGELGRSQLQMCVTFVCEHCQT